MLFDNVIFSLVSLDHQFWNKFQKDKVKEQCKNMWSDYRGDWA